MPLLKPVLTCLLLCAASIMAAMVLAGDDALLRAVLIVVGVAASLHVLRRALHEVPQAR